MCTGRAGATGTAITFVSREDVNLLRDIEKMMGQMMEAENDQPPGYNRTITGSSKSKGNRSAKKHSSKSGAKFNRKRKNRTSKNRSTRGASTNTSRAQHI